MANGQKPLFEQKIPDWKTWQQFSGAIIVILHALINLSDSYVLIVDPSLAASLPVWPRNGKFKWGRVHFGCEHRHHA